MIISWYLVRQCFAPYAGFWSLAYGIICQQYGGDQ